MRIGAVAWTTLLTAACCSCDSKSKESSDAMASKAVQQDSITAQQEELESLPPREEVPSSPIPILEYMVPKGKTDSTTDSFEHQELRVGFRGFDDQIQFFRPGRPGFIYHVLSVFGQDLHVQTSPQESRTFYCNDSISIWKIGYKYDAKNVAHKPLSTSSYYKGFLVVGTKNDIHIKPPPQTVPSESSKQMCLAALKPDTQLYSCNFFSAGRTGNIERIVVQANGPFEHGNQGFIGVVDTDGEKYTVQFKTNDNWIGARYFEGQADLDGDGLSDVFLVNHESHGGYEILAQRNGAWIAIHDHGRPTCS